MIIFLFSLWTLFSPTSNCEEMDTIRAIYHEIETKEELQKFIEKIEVMNCELAQPYLASAVMQNAEHVFLPTEKLKYFSQGKSILENYIQSHPLDIEARYIRVLVQKNIPAILGYKRNIESDIHFIKNHIADSTLPAEFKQLMMANIDK